MKNGSVAGNGKVVKSNGTSTGNGFLPFSIKFMSSCIKTVSSNVISASDSDDHHRKDQVLWACFDRLELGPTTVKQVLLIGYSNGFQVLDVEDASNISELVSRRDDPVTFLQMQPLPAKCGDGEGFRKSHPMLLVVASDGTGDSGPTQYGKDSILRDGSAETHVGNVVNSPTTVRFYSLRAHNYVHILRFRSTVYMIRCSNQIVAVGLAAQIYCFDALTLENKFSVLTHPIPQLGGLGTTGVNNGYGPMAVGPRWLAYTSNNPLHTSTGRLSPQSLSSSPGVSPSTSPSSGNLVARFAVESSKHLAAGLINLGGTGYKTLSKYCHDYLPDGSGSPVSSNSNWRVGRNASHSIDTDAAGMVIIKDFNSRATIAQFRAHNSPISALCFDPSGTLLVTASIHGNNINVFRIMPSYLQNGSGSHTYNFNASHVHLYKLRRGMTSAVIQDICFSHFSQWVAIVSSKGTCHVYVLSPFGGETGLQLVHSHTDGSSLLPVLSMPWWSTSCFLTSQQSSPPPPIITLSVVSRIKNSGWFSSMSNTASSAAGKLLVPSGAVAAVFHSALCQTMQSTSPNRNILEHLLVYSPSGHLLQYELLPWLGGDHGESFSRNGPGSLIQMQEEELRVKVEPVRWWDVCRRADWPDTEENINGVTIGRLDKASEDKDLVKPLDRSPWYLSNAEVQLRSGRTPIWQNSKIGFHVMDSCGNENQNEGSDQPGGEIEIEQIPVCEIQIRRKDLLPIFDNFHGSNPPYGDDRKRVDGRHTPSIISSSKDKLDDSMTSETKLISIGVSGNSNPSSLMSSGSLYDYNGSSLLTPVSNVGLSVVQNESISYSNGLSSASLKFGIVSASPESPVNFSSSVEENYVVNSRFSPTNEYYVADSGETPFQVSQVHDADGTIVSTTKFSGVDNAIKEEQRHEDIHQTVGFGQYFQEDYCEEPTNSEFQELAAVLADVGNDQSFIEKEKDDDDGSDDMLGGVFAFSEEDSGETPFQVSQVHDADGTIVSTTKFSGVDNAIKEEQRHEDIHQTVGFGQYFQEDYCEEPTNSKFQELAAVLADVGNDKSFIEKEKDDDIII